MDQVETDTGQQLNADVKRALDDWLEHSKNFAASTLAKGYQGKIALFEHNQQKFVIKAALGRGIAGWLLSRTLQHEYEVYKQLVGMDGIPRCYGLIQRRYMVLEYIEGKPLRDIATDQPESFFSSLLSIIQCLHKRNVAHMDLKRKDNILVHGECDPYLIDFGVAIIFKPGFHPLNHYLFKLAKQFDLNAWVKHKYKRQIDGVSTEDAKYFSKTVEETVSSAVKRFYKKWIKSVLRKFK